MYLLLLFNCYVVSDSLQPQGHRTSSFPVLQSLSPRVCSNSCPLSQWCCLTISSFPTLFFCLQSFWASGSWPMSRLFTSGGQSIGVSATASVLPMNIQNWFPLGLTGWISLLSKGLSRHSDSDKFLITIMIYHLIAGDCYCSFSSFLCGCQG